MPADFPPYSTGDKVRIKVGNRAGEVGRIVSYAYGEGSFGYDVAFGEKAMQGPYVTSDVPKYGYMDWEIERFTG